MLSRFGNLQNQVSQQEQALLRSELQSRELDFQEARTRSLGSGRSERNLLFSIGPSTTNSSRHHFLKHRNTIGTGILYQRVSQLCISLQFKFEKCVRNGANRTQSRLQSASPGRSTIGILLRAGGCGHACTRVLCFSCRMNSQHFCSKN